MSDAAPLRPATADEIAETLSFALRFDGRRRVHHADDAMTRITVERLVKHLERSGFVLMKRPPLPAHSTPAQPPEPEYSRGRAAGVRDQAASGTQDWRVAAGDAQGGWRD